jgi:hypothetical protein
MITVMAALDAVRTLRLCCGASIVGCAYRVAIADMGSADMGSLSRGAHLASELC